MRRREFISLVAGATAWPLAAREQAPGRLPTVVLLGDRVSVWGTWIAAFAQRMHDLGWIEGRTVAIEYRWSEGRPERVAEFAAEFVQQKVDVIVTYGGAVATLKQATTSIPIVFAQSRAKIDEGKILPHAISVGKDLGAWLTLLHLVGPEGMPGKTVPDFAVDSFTVWRAASPASREYLRRDGETIVCRELGTRFCAAAVA
jgi:hypothetical protein